MSSSVIFLVLVMCQAYGLFAQTVTPNPGVETQKTVPKSVGMPKPAVDPTVGTWKYKGTVVAPADTHHGPLLSTYSITIKDEGDAWTVTLGAEFPEGPVTDVSTLEKGTLILRKELFKHFLHPDQPWKPVEVNLDFAGNKVTGTMKYVGRTDKQVAVELSGPAFADSASSDVTIGCLPLAEGYSATFRYFDIERLGLNPQAPDKEKLMQLKVVGMERVTVPAGTFDSYKVELASSDGSYKETVWIAKDSRVSVKEKTLELFGKKRVTVVNTAEMVP